VLVAAFDVFGEVAVAELLDDVIVFAALHDIVETDDVVGVYFLEDVDLVFEGGLQVWVGVDWVGKGVLLSLARILTATC
jgi:hypothetical protein